MKEDLVKIVQEEAEYTRLDKKNIAPLVSNKKKRLPPPHDINPRS
jgi:hypothetical protein